MDYVNSPVRALKEKKNLAQPLQEPLNYKNALPCLVIVKQTLAKLKVET